MKWILIMPLAACTWTLFAHVLDESDHCSLAQSCAHDGVEARGLALDHRTVRLFLDACDLHEYNCDHNANFKLVIVSSAATQTENCNGATEEIKQTTDNTVIEKDEDNQQDSGNADTEQNQDNDNLVQEPSGEQVPSNNK